eukprot:613512-Pyramimonas_sp.AAC.1
MHVTGTNTMVSFMGAVRSGFRESIQALPSDLREHVEKYITERLNKLREQKRTRKLLACDILFGTKDPFNCYYSEEHFDINITSKQLYSHDIQPYNANHSIASTGSVFAMLSLLVYFSVSE